MVGEVNKVIPEGRRTAKRSAWLATALAALLHSACRPRNEIENAHLRLSSAPAKEQITECNHRAKPPDANGLTSRQSAIIDEFIRLTNEAGHDEPSRSKLERFVSSLGRDDQLLIARVLVEQFGHAYDLSAIALFVRNNKWEDSVPVAADYVAAGGDMAQAGFALLHTDDPSQALLFYVAICRRLMKELPSMVGSQREHVQRFLCNGGAGAPLKEFDIIKVRERLVFLERAATSTTLPAGGGTSPIER